MANEQKIQQVKGKKINFYKFVGKIDSKRGVFTSIGDSKVTQGLNNLGSTVNGIARVLDEYVQLSAKNFIAQQKLTKAKSKPKEDPGKKGRKLSFTSGVVGSFGKIVAEGAGGILGLFGSLFKLFIVLPVLDWMRKEENQKKLQSIVGALAEIGKFLYKIVSGTVYVTLELIAGFTKLPFWKEILKFGLFMAALGTSFLAFRKLFGGKAVKFVVKQVFSLFKGFFKALLKFSAKLTKFIARSSKRLLRGGKGKVGKMVLGAAAAFGASYAIDRIADGVTGKDLDDAEKELSDLELQDEKDNKKEVELFKRDATKAISDTEAKSQAPAKEKAVPSPVGGVQPAPGRDVPQGQAPEAPSLPSPTPTRGVGGILPQSTPVPPELPPPAATPPMSRGGRLPRRAEGGTVPTAAAPSLPKKLGKFEPLSKLDSFLGKKKAEVPVNDAQYKKQQKLIPTLVYLPMKMVGLATIGVINNLAKVLSKVPGAGFLSKMMQGLVGPVASAFGLKATIGSMSKGGGTIAQKKKQEEEKKKQEISKVKAQAQIEERNQAYGANSSGYGEAGGYSPRNFGRTGNGKPAPAKKPAPARSKFLGLFAAGGGWIQGPQTGYPVSLDGGKSVAFIGHGTEYVATKSGGGNTRSAYVVPFDTPATRGNKNLTGRRMGEAMSAGFKFSQGGDLNTTGNVPNDALMLSGEKPDTKTESAKLIAPKAAGSNLTPMQQWAKNFPDLARKVKPGQSGYDEIQSYLNSRATGNAWDLGSKGIQLAASLGLTTDFSKSAFGSAPVGSRAFTGTLGTGYSSPIANKSELYANVAKITNYKEDGSKIYEQPEGLPEAWKAARKQLLKDNADGQRRQRNAGGFINWKQWGGYLRKIGFRPNENAFDPGKYNNAAHRTPNHGYNAMDAGYFGPSGNSPTWWNETIAWEKKMMPLQGKSFGQILGPVSDKSGGHGRNASDTNTHLHFTAMKLDGKGLIPITPELTALMGNPKPLSAEEVANAKGVDNSGNPTPSAAEGATQEKETPQQIIDKFLDAINKANASLEGKSLGGFLRKMAGGGALQTKGASIAKDLQNMLGIKDYQAAAIVGNVNQESGLVADRIQGSGMRRGPLKLDGVTGYSYPQWTSIDRQKNFAKYMESKGHDWKNKGATDALATGFLAQEFKTYMSSVFTGTKEVVAASNWVLKNYEKPADQGPREQKERSDDSKTVLAAMGGATGTGLQLDPNNPNAPDANATGKGAESVDPKQAFLDAIDKALASLGQTPSGSGTDSIGGTKPATPGAPTPTGGTQPAPTKSAADYLKMSSDQLNKLLDPTKTGASDPTIFEAAKRAREEGRAQGLNGAELEHYVKAHTAAAKYRSTANPPTTNPANVKPAAAPTSQAVKQSTETNGIMKAQIAADKASAANQYAQSIAKQGQATAKATALNKKVQYASGGQIEIPIGGGGSKNDDDIVKYRPGFGLFAGIGGSGL